MQARLTGVGAGRNEIFCVSTKWPPCILQGLGKASETDDKAASWSFLQQTKTKNKNRAVPSPYRPLTARPKVFLRLSTNLTLGPRKENSRLVLRGNANTILTKAFSSKEHCVCSDQNTGCPGPGPAGLWVGTASGNPGDGAAESCVRAARGAAAVPQAACRRGLRTVRPFPDTDTGPPQGSRLFPVLVMSPLPLRP